MPAGDQCAFGHTQEQILRAPGSGITFRAMTDLGGQAPERELLSGFLDWHRAVVVRKVDGLPLADATKVMTPTGLSPLSVVAHLAAVELGWFDETFLGRPEDQALADHGNFQLSPEDTVESVVSEYHRACERSRAIVAEATSLDVLSSGQSRSFGHVSLRWILAHMLEETARHAGHLDIMREAIDGTTGD